jgi:hypothetical protein
MFWILGCFLLSVFAQGLENLTDIQIEGVIFVDKSLIQCVVFVVEWEKEDKTSAFSSFYLMSFSLERNLDSPFISAVQRSYSILVLKSKSLE